MPTVFRSDGIKYFFYSNEGQPREPLHIHVLRGSAEAKIWLQPTIGLAWNRGLGPTKFVLFLTLFDNAKS